MRARRHSLGLVTLLVLSACATPPAAGQMYEMPPKVETRAYPVDKAVADFPPEEDFSKPESAYATIHRRLAAGRDDWRSMSVKRLGAKLPPGSDKPRPVSERAAKGWMGAKIVEVRMISESNAYVLAQWPASGSIDVRGLEVEGGRWLNVSNQQADTIEDARRIVDEVSTFRRSATWWRKRNTYPQEYLKRFVEYLNNSSKDPKELMLQKLEAHKLVIVGQIPHRPTYWSFLTGVVADDHFPFHAGVIYLELPSSGQESIDRFLTADKPDSALLVEMLRDHGPWMGEPDQSLLEFLQGVWNVNQNLPKEKHVRVVLVGAPRPWAMIKSPGDLKAYDALDHDELTAASVLKDMKAHAGDARHALLVVGYEHAAKSIRLASAAAQGPLKTAGWRLAQDLGADNCYAFFQHSPQISGDGKVYGRAARGLFDSAFRATDYKPAAFELRGSPFGGEPFDVNNDWESIGSVQEAFDGYVMLERLEDEWVSSVIEGFYTDEFVKELDRRSRIVENKPLDEVLGIDEPSGRSVERWLSRTWGSPRDWRDRMGSIDAWQRSEGEEPPPQ